MDTRPTYADPDDGETAVMLTRAHAAAQRDAYNVLRERVVRARVEFNSAMDRYMQHVYRKPCLFRDSMCNYWLTQVRTRAHTLRHAERDYALYNARLSLRVTTNKAAYLEKRTQTLEADIKRLRDELDATTYDLTQARARLYTATKDRQRTKDAARKVLAAYRQQLIDEEYRSVSETVRADLAEERCDDPAAHRMDRETLRPKKTFPPPARRKTEPPDAIA